MDDKGVGIIKLLSEATKHLLAWQFKHSVNPTCFMDNELDPLEDDSLSIDSCAVHPLPCIIFDGIIPYHWKGWPKPYIDKLKVQVIW